MHAMGNDDHIAIQRCKDKEELIAVKISTVLPHELQHGPEGAGKLPVVMLHSSFTTESMYNRIGSCSVREQ